MTLLDQQHELLHRHWPGNCLLCSAQEENRRLKEENENIRESFNYWDYERRQTDAERDEYVKQHERLERAVRVNQNKASGLVPQVLEALAALDGKRGGWGTTDIPDLRER